MSSTHYPNLLRFDLNAKQIESTSDEVIQNVKNRLQQLVSIEKEKRNFDNTFSEFAELEGFYSPQISSCYFPSYVSSDKELRDAATAANKKLEMFFIDVFTREDVYNALRDCKDNLQKSGAFSKLRPIDHRLIEKIIEEFERNGLALDAEKRSKLKEIKQKLSEKSIVFQQNLNEDVSKHYFTKEELDGLPDDFLESLTKNDEGKYAVSLKYPELFPVLEQCKVAETRKKMDFLNGTKCIQQNTVLLEDVILLRQEESKLLGYKNHADFNLAVKMAKNSENVMKFLNDLTQKLDEPANKDIQTLLKAKEVECKERNEPFDGKLNVWDWRYYEQLLLQKDYQVNQDEIKEYFPMEKVTDGLLDIYQQVLSLKFVKMAKEKTHVWHEDVQQYEVYDRESGEFVGHFYLDLFPRDGKYGHAAEFDVQKGFILKDGSKRYPAAAMVANFTKPTATKPSLLKMDEVVTYFHEFGHVMHEICTKSPYFRFAGTRVEQDFVEAPSQMLENWCYDREILKKISGHFKDLSKTLPDDLLNNILRSKYFLEPLKNRRQLHFGTFDMLAHTAVGKVDSAALWHKCMKEVALTESQPGTNGAAGFGHLLGGYSAGYYGYLYSKVFSSDMFIKFKDAGLLNSSVGKSYRDLILATGGTKDSMEVLVQFLGRNPDSNAFLVEIGAITL